MEWCGENLQERTEPLSTGPKQLAEDGEAGVGRRTSIEPMTCDDDDDDDDAEQCNYVHSAAAAKFSRKNPGNPLSTDPFAHSAPIRSF